MLQPRTGNIRAWSKSGVVEVPEKGGRLSSLPCKLGQAGKPAPTAVLPHLEPRQHSGMVKGQVTGSGGWSVAVLRVARRETVTLALTPANGTLRNTLATGYPTDTPFEPCRVAQRNASVTPCNTIP